MSWLEGDLSTTLDSSIANMNSIEPLKAKEEEEKEVAVLLYHCCECRKNITFWKVAHPSPVCPSDKLSI